MRDFFLNGYFLIYHLPIWNHYLGCTVIMFKQMGAFKTEKYFTIAGFWVFLRDQGYHERELLSLWSGGYSRRMTHTYITSHLTAQNQPREELNHFPIITCSVTWYKGVSRRGCVHFIAHRAGGLGRRNMNHRPFSFLPISVICETNFRIISSELLQIDHKTGMLHNIGWKVFF